MLKGTYSLENSNFDRGLSDVSQQDYIFLRHKGSLKTVISLGRFHELLRKEALLEEEIGEPHYPQDSPKDRLKQIKESLRSE